MAFGPSYTCPECGTSFPKMSSHTCDPKKVEEFLVSKFKKDLRGAELTARMKRNLEFLEWCRDNGRP